MKNKLLKLSLIIIIAFGAFILTIGLNKSCDDKPKYQTMFINGMPVRLSDINLSLRITDKDYERLLKVKSYLGTTSDIEAINDALKLIEKLHERKVDGYRVVIVKDNTLSEVEFK
jgi:hypothetical protein